MAACRCQPTAASSRHSSCLLFCPVPVCWEPQASVLVAWSRLVFRSCCWAIFVVSPARFGWSIPQLLSAVPVLFVTILFLPPASLGLGLCNTVFNVQLPLRITIDVLQQCTLSLFHSRSKGAVHHDSEAVTLRPGGCTHDPGTAPCAKSSASHHKMISIATLRLSPAQSLPFPPHRIHPVTHVLPAPQQF